MVRGCVPKKLLVYGSDFAQHFRDAHGFGWTIEGSRFDWPTLRDNVQHEVSRLSGIYRENLDAAGVATLEDRAAIVEANTVRMKKSGKTFTAERILIATGGHTFLPRELSGYELGITSTDAFHLAEAAE